MHILDNTPQGSPQWHAARASHFCASEASAAMGVSKYTTRSALLQQKAAGIAEEVTPAKQRLFDAGHASEASTRAIAEEIAGVEFFPVVGTADVGGLQLLASFDGIDVMDEITWENKLLNQSLVAQIAAGDLEPHYWAQLEHQLLVSGAPQALFTTSDGTPEGTHHLWYASRPERRTQLVAAWKQFAADLAAYTPPTPTAVAVAAPMDSLPAVSVQLQGQLVVASNLPLFGAALRAFIERIPAKASTDQEFADTEAACKALKKAEEALDAADEHSLASLSDVAAARKLMADLRNLARTTRLTKEKDVAARKEQIRHEIVADGRQLLAAHVAALVQRLGNPYLPAIAEDFGGVIKGKKTVASLRDAVATELARAKIAANEVADRIALNLATLRERAADFAFLFADTARLVLKQPDDLAAIVTARISEHEAKEAARLAAERERIAAEEKVKAEAAAAADAKRQADEAAATARAEERARIDAEAAAMSAAWVVLQAEQARVAQPEPVMAPAPAVLQMPARAAAPAAAPLSAPTLTLGTIGKRLGFALTAEFLKGLGFEPADRQRASLLFHEAQFPRICAALVRHIEGVQALESA